MQEKRKAGLTQAELVSEALKGGFKSGSGNCAKMVQRACTRLVKKNKLSRDDDMKYHSRSSGIGRRQAPTCSPGRFGRRRSGDRRSECVIPSGGSHQHRNVGCYATRRLLDQLVGITDGLNTFLDCVVKLDWSQEDEEQWTKAAKAVSAAIASIATKVEKGFKTIRKEGTRRPPTKPQMPTREVTIKKLKSLYGNHAEPVLEEFLKELPKKDGKMRTYKILKPLPTCEEFEVLKRKQFTSPVGDLVDCAFGSFGDLAGEMGDWYDNLPESFQQGDKGSLLEDARSTLENLSPPDVSERIGALPVYYLPHKAISSRASRRDDAVGRLQAVVDALSPVEDGEDAELVDELENAIGEAEGVEFPGMY